MQISRKLSVSVLNNIRKGFKNVTESRYVGRIYGIARGAVVEEGVNGPYIKFVGEFRGVSPTGEIFAAPVAFLPAPADGLLADAVKGDQHGSGVQFGFDFYIEPREDVAIGYSYVTKPLMEQKPSDPLAALENQIAPVPALVGRVADAAQDEPVRDVRAEEELARAKAAKGGKK